MFDELPEAARKVLAYRASFLHTFGFEDGQVFLGPAVIEHGLPPPAGHVWLVAVISVAGDAAKPDFCAIGGAVPVDWNADVMLMAWNTLDQEQRNAMRKREVGEREVTMMALQLAARGIVPPNVLREVGLEPQTRGRN